MSALCRSRRELSNAYFVAKFGLDTAENEPSQVCPTERPTDGLCRRTRAKDGLVFTQVDDVPAVVLLPAQRPGDRHQTWAIGNNNIWSE